MRWRCSGGILQCSAVFNRRTWPLVHLTICSLRIRWSERITPRIPKTIHPRCGPRSHKIPIQSAMEAVLFSAERRRSDDVRYARLVARYRQTLLTYLGERVMSLGGAHLPHRKL